MSQKKTAVVGAGMAGLYAAYLLRQEGFDPFVLEASGRPGGRIRSLVGFAPYPLELGARFVHGRASVLYELAKYMELPLVRYRERTYAFYRGNLLSPEKAAEEPPLVEAVSAMEDLWRYEGPEKSLLDHFSQLPYFNATQGILAGFAAEYGAPLAALGAKSLAAEEAKWTSGHIHYTFELPYERILKGFLEETNGIIRYNAPVAKIRWGGQEVIIEDSHGNTYSADTCLVTVPLAVLKAGKISFDPPLPANKQKAIDALGMGPGLVVHLKFKECFWPKGMKELFGGHLCQNYLAPGAGRDGNHILTAFLMGESARELAGYGLQLPGMLAGDLDHMFGGNVASRLLEDHVMADWGNEPHIGGAYSYAAPGSVGQRTVLAQPLSGKLFFAGEACNTQGHAATVHGAMESAEKAVESMAGIYA